MSGTVGPQAELTLVMGGGADRLAWPSYCQGWLRWYDGDTDGATLATDLASSIKAKERIVVTLMGATDPTGVVTSLVTSLGGTVTSIV